jgi:hypothetical protein
VVNVFKRVFVCLSTVAFFCFFDAIFVFRFLTQHHILFFFKKKDDDDTDKSDVAGRRVSFIYFENNLMMFSFGFKKSLMIFFATKN